MLQAQTQKKLNDIPAVASAGLGSRGTAMVASTKTAEIRQARLRAATGVWPERTNRQEIAPPSKRAEIAANGTIQV